MIDKFFVLGERCSGTNYLHQLMLKNFKLEEWECGHKHFFLNTDFRNRPDVNINNVLILGIIRHPIEWLASLRHNPHHLEYRGKLLTHGEPLNWTDFLDMPVKSLHCYPADDTRFPDYRRNSEVVEDRNPETGLNFPNLFDLRRAKNLFLTSEITRLVPNYKLVIYENLVKDPVGVLRQIEQEFGLARLHANYVDHDLYKNSRIPYVPRIYSYEIPVRTHDTIISRLDAAAEQNLGFRLSLKTALIYEPNQCHTELFPFWVELLLNAGFTVDLAFTNNTEIGDFIRDRFASRQKFIRFVDRKASRLSGYDLLILNSYYAFGRDILDYRKFKAKIKLIVYHNVSFLPDVNRRAEMRKRDNIVFVNLHSRQLSETTSLLPIFGYRTSRPSLPKTPKLFTIINNRSDLDLFRRTVSRLSGFKWVVINNLTDTEVHRHRLTGILKNPRLSVFYKISESKKFKLVEACHFVVCFQNNQEYQTFRLSGLIPLAVTVRRPLIMDRDLAKGFQLTAYYDINNFKAPVDSEHYCEQLAYLKRLRARTSQGNARTLVDLLTRCNGSDLLVGDSLHSEQRLAPTPKKPENVARLPVFNRVFR